MGEIDGCDVIQLSLDDDHETERRRLSDHVYAAFIT